MKKIFTFIFGAILCFTGISFVWTQFQVPFRVYNNVHGELLDGQEEQKEKILTNVISNQSDLEIFFQKTMSEIESSQPEIKKLVEMEGESAGYEVIKEIIFNNFSQIPNVVSDTVISTVTIETRKVN